MPASRISGTDTASRQSAMACGLRIPRPLPIGDPSGITAAQPASSSRRASTGSSVVYGSTTKPSATSSRAACRSSTASGSSVRRSPITSSFSQGVSNASRAEVRRRDRLAGAEAAGGVRQHARAAALDRVVQPARRLLHPPQGDRHDLGAARCERRLEPVEAVEAAGAEQQPRADLGAGDDERVVGHVSLRPSRAAPRAARPRRASSSSHADARHDGAVQRDRDAALVGAGAGGHDGVAHRRARGELDRPAVQLHVHANRRGSNERASAGTRLAARRGGDRVGRPAAAAARRGGSRRWPRRGRRRRRRWRGAGRRWPAAAPPPRPPAAAPPAPARCAGRPRAGRTRRPP